MTGLRIGGFAASAAEVTAFSGASITTDESGWGSSIESLELYVEELEVAEQLRASGNIRFGNLTIGDSGATVKTAVSLPPNGRANWNDLIIALPGFSGINRWFIRNVFICGSRLL